MREIRCPLWKQGFFLIICRRSSSPICSSTVNKEREGRLWEDLFLNPSEWWDNRNSTQHPDFRHKTLREPLWLSSPYKPMWVDSRLSGLLHPYLPSPCHTQIQRLCDLGELDEALQILLTSDDHSPAPYWSLAKACNQTKSLIHAEHLFRRIVDLGLKFFSLTAEYLVSTFARCGDFEAALDAFHALPYRSSFSWTAVISMFLEWEKPREALHMYQSMQDDSVKPNERTFVAVLQACGNIVDLEKGRAIHREAERAGVVNNAFVGCTLVSMYGKCGSIMEAEEAFAGMPARGVVSWTAMLSAYVEQGQEEVALQCYNRMQEECICANDRTFVVVLQACSEFGEREVTGLGEWVATIALEIGQELHANARRKGFHSDVFVGSTLVSMYGKCRSVREAENVLVGMPLCNVVSWNAMLSAYVDCGLEMKALQLYVFLLWEHVDVNKRTFAIAIQACSSLAEREEALTVNRQSIKSVSLEIIAAIHAVAHTKGFVKDTFVGSALVRAYGKCGNVIEAEKVFFGLDFCDLILWTGMLIVYVEQGEGKKALRLYQRMQERGMTLDDVTIVCALQVCTDLESISTCQQIHFVITSSISSLNELLGVSLIHSYGGCSHVEDGQIIFDGLTSHSVMLCTSLMDGYAREGNYGRCLEKFDEMKMAGISPDGVTFLLALGACGHMGHVDKGVEYFESMKRVYGISPEIRHYVSVVDLLGRVGDFSRLKRLLLEMSTEPNMALCLSLLDACQTYGNVEMAEWAFDWAMALNPEEPTAYALMSSIYANAGLLDRARLMMMGH